MLGLRQREISDEDKWNGEKRGAENRSKPIAQRTTKQLKGEHSLHVMTQSFREKRQRIVSVTANEIGSGHGKKLLYTVGGMKQKPLPIHAKQQVECSRGRHRS